MKRRKPRIDDKERFEDLKGWSDRMEDYDYSISFLKKYDQQKSISPMNSQKIQNKSKAPYLPKITSNITGNIRQLKERIKKLQYDQISFQNTREPPSFFLEQKIQERSPSISCQKDKKFKKIQTRPKIKMKKKEFSFLKMKCYRTKLRDEKKNKSEHEQKTFEKFSNNRKINETYFNDIQQKIKKIEQKKKLWWKAYFNNFKKKTDRQSLSLSCKKTKIPISTKQTQKKNRIKGESSFKNTRMHWTEQKERKGEINEGISTLLKGKYEIFKDDHLQL